MGRHNRPPERYKQKREKGIAAKRECKYIIKSITYNMLI
jgi:hypothetical protein